MVPFGKVSRDSRSRKYSELSNLGLGIFLLGWSLLTASLLCVAVQANSFGQEPRASTGEDRRLPMVAPEATGMNGESLQRIDREVEAAIEAGETPGAVVVIGHQGSIVYRKAFGHRQIEPTPEPMTVDTLFDLASLTKPVATATSVMRLVEQGKIRLRDPAAKYWDGFGQNGKESITIEQLLTHVSGLTPDNSLSDYADGPEQAMERIRALPVRSEPGSKFAYSDVGFIVLAEIVKTVTGQDVAAYSHDEIFAPLGMHDTGYNPSSKLQQRAAATEKRQGNWIKGEVHDPRAFALDGIAGHAGLFSTADDLAIYAQMMINGGRFAETRILGQPTVDLMTKAYPVPRGTRGLGWDKRSPYSSNRGESMSESAFGHGGFTGTAMWIDPDLKLFVIFLSTRLHPDGKGSVNGLAGRIGTMAAGAINSSAIDSEVGATRTGLDRLIDSDFRLMKGKRIGLITNQTGITRSGDSNVTHFASSKQIQLTALFSPEHGFAGTLDTSQINDSRETKTGLPIYSLYGDTRRPTAEMLRDVDVLVFDIQDIGTRFYTYLSTMGEAMIAAAEHGKQFVVLDRPNPLGGLVCDGPVLDAGMESFVGFHPIPVQHGMTLGELARLMRSDLELDLDLVVVECDRWQRSMTFDQTGLLWVNPSPNMRSLTEAMLYPGIGLLETTNISVGRGTDTPFEVIGAPWLDAQQLSTALNEAKLPGVSFVPIRFQPDASVFAGERCQGVSIQVTNRQIFQPVPTGLEVALTLQRLYPGTWQIGRYGRLLSDQQVLDAVQRLASCDEIQAIYAAELDEFRLRRKAFLLYP